MEEKKNKNLSDKELKLFHEFFADSLIELNSCTRHSHFSDRYDSEVTSATIKKEESKFLQSLRNREDIPTEVWMG